MRRWLSGSICFVIVGFCSIAFAQQSFYSIHIISHKQQTEADTEVKKLEAKGLEAFSRHVAVQGKGKWYRIYVGKYATKKEAANDIKRLKQMKVSKYFAVSQLTEKKPAAKEPAVAAATTAPASPSARPATAEPVNYYLFVGFYRDLAQAQNEVTRLNKALVAYGYRAQLTRETVADGMMYRVYVGTFTDRQLAAESGAELKEKKVLTSFYIPVQTPQDMIAESMQGPAAGVGAATVATAATADTDAAGSTSDEVQEAADEEPAAQSSFSEDDTKDDSRFMIMLKGGGYSPQNVNKFAISETGLTGTTIYRISDEATPQIGLEGAFRFNRFIGLYGSADTVRINGINWYNFAAGPILTVQAGDSVMPYLKGGAVYGNFSWDDAPGKFDSAVGWEVGTGLNFLKGHYKLGIDFNYRNLSFDYEAPNDPLVSATEDSLDMSGFSLMATISYWF